MELSDKRCQLLPVVTWYYAFYVVPVPRSEHVFFSIDRYHKLSVSSSEVMTVTTPVLKYKTLAPRRPGSGTYHLDIAPVE
jgi:hypothetical protein